jgi:carbon-monoxide dehydrogenase medium subunit
LVGKRFDRGTARAAAAATKAITPISDIHASSDYRRHLAEVLVFRSLRDAAERCGIRI